MRYARSQSQFSVAADRLACFPQELRRLTPHGGPRSPFTRGSEAYLGRGAKVAGWEGARYPSRFPGWSGAEFDLTDLKNLHAEAREVADCVIRAGRAVTDLGQSCTGLDKLGQVAQVASDGRLVGDPALIRALEPFRGLLSLGNVPLDFIRMGIQIQDWGHALSSMSKQYCAESAPRLLSRLSREPRPEPTPSAVRYEKWVRPETPPSFREWTPEIALERRGRALKVCMGLWAEGRCIRDPEWPAEWGWPRPEK